MKPSRSTVPLSPHLTVPFHTARLLSAVSRSTDPARAARVLMMMIPSSPSIRRECTWRWHWSFGPVSFVPFSGQKAKINVNVSDNQDDTCIAHDSMQISVNECLIRQVALPMKMIKKMSWRVTSSPNSTNLTKLKGVCLRMMIGWSFDEPGAFALQNGALLPMK